MGWVLRSQEYFSSPWTKWEVKTWRPKPMNAEAKPRPILSGGHPCEKWDLLRARSGGSNHVVVCGPGESASSLCALLRGKACEACTELQWPDFIGQNNPLQSGECCTWLLRCDAMCWALMVLLQHACRLGPIGRVLCKMLRRNMICCEACDKLHETDVIGQVWPDRVATPKSLFKIFSELFHITCPLCFRFTIRKMLYVALRANYKKFKIEY